MIVLVQSSEVCSGIPAGPLSAGTVWVSKWEANLVPGPFAKPGYNA